MKHLLFLALCMHTLHSVAAIQIKQSRVTDVTIYRQYAKEVRMGSATIPQGQSEVIISPVTEAIDENSIQVGCKNQVKILSVSSRLNYITDEKGLNPGKVLVWQDSVKLLDKKSRFLLKQKEAYESELGLLGANSKLGSEQESLKPAQLKELMELHRAKQLELKKLLFDAEESYKEMQQSMTLLQQQIAESNNHALGKPVREIVLKVSSSTEVNTSFRISYLVTAASWTPTYEIRCEGVNQPLVLNCRARIKQQTGFHWKGVHIKLSTANPNQNHNRPVLYPIYVDFMQPDYYRTQLESEARGGYKNLMNEKSAAAPASVQMMGTGGGRYADADDFKDGLKVEGNAVTVAEGDMMVEYDVEELQDIESDGQEHIMAIQDIKMPAVYQYHSVPKLDNAVFLLACVTDWGRYNLLAGDATLFFDDMYIGKSYLNPNVSSDTLRISLGRDEKINVKRVKLNELCSTKRLSNRKKETRAYETLLKNNKQVAVEVEVLDQYPISKNTDIEVELEEAVGAQITKDYGKVLWRVKLQPGESKKVKLVYSVRYPEDKFIAEKN